MKSDLERLKELADALDNADVPSTVRFVSGEYAASVCEAYTAEVDEILLSIMAAGISIDDVLDVTPPFLEIRNGDMLIHGTVDLALDSYVIEIRINNER